MAMVRSSCRVMQLGVHSMTATTSRVATVARENAIGHACRPDGGFHLVRRRAQMQFSGARVGHCASPVSNCPAGIARAGASASTCCTEYTQPCAAGRRPLHFRSKSPGGVMMASHSPGRSRQLLRRFLGPGRQSKRPVDRAGPRAYPHGVNAPPVYYYTYFSDYLEISSGDQYSDHARRR